jgi:FMN phosphatase YigB (HAD superfamily)
MKGLLITDLDNTLYDWVTYFGRSIRALTESLADLLRMPVDEVQAEMKLVNQRLGSVERPFAIFELPSVRARFPGATPQQLKHALDEPLHAFNRERVRSLALYPGVADALVRAQRLGVRVVGYTEASVENAYYRLSKLGVAAYIERLYVIEAAPVVHPDRDRSAALAPPVGFAVVVPREDRKPNPKVLLDICAGEGVDARDALYVGDSHSKDVAMARRAGVAAAWARYGTRYADEDWAAIVRITNWTESDVQREREIRGQAADVIPDFILDEFADVLTILGGQ